jgi:hypothetical protein
MGLYRIAPLSLSMSELAIYHSLMIDFTKARFSVSILEEGGRVSSVYSSVTSVWAINRQLVSCGGTIFIGHAPQSMHMGFTVGCATSRMSLGGYLVFRTLRLDVLIDTVDIIA